MTVICDQARTAQLLDIHAVIDAIADAAIEHSAGKILSPERLVVPFGPRGVMLRMPATGCDIGIHKLVNVHPSNARRQLPTIHGIVTVCDAGTGEPLFQLDGSEVTGRRTAALSMLAIRTSLERAPEQVLIIGTGSQARYHLQALCAVYPRCQIWARGRSPASAERFCRDARSAHENLAVCPEHIPEGVQAVITLTTSTEPIYDEPAQLGRVIVGVGAFKPEMAEIGKTTLEGSDLYADDPAAAQHEAGDLIRAGVEWGTVRSLADMLRSGPDRTRPSVFKSVGTAAWDLAAARVALASLSSQH